jgi:hypothetical protein
MGCSSKVGLLRSVEEFNTPSTSRLGLSCQMLFRHLTQNHHAKPIVGINRKMSHCRQRGSEIV